MKVVSLYFLTKQQKVRLKKTPCDMLEHNKKHILQFKNERKKKDRTTKRERNGKKGRGNIKRVYYCLRHRSTCCPKSDVKHLFCKKQHQVPPDTGTAILVRQQKQIYIFQQYQRVYQYMLIVSNVKTITSNTLFHPGITNK